MKILKNFLRMHFIIYQKCPFKRQLSLAGYAQSSVLGELSRSITLFLMMFLILFTKRCDTNPASSTTALIQIINTMVETILMNKIHVRNWTRFQLNLTKIRLTKVKIQSHLRILRIVKANLLKQNNSSKAENKAGRSSRE